jgi:mannose/cellobiose epimerase-like protein (N-acyl-D-glucosamine 2-epimerase family)
MLVQISCLRFVMDRFADHQYGEVYTAVFQDGKIDSQKVGPWKAPYHVTRACLEIISPGVEPCSCGR